MAMGLRVTSCLLLLLLGFLANLQGCQALSCIPCHEVDCTPLRRRCWYGIETDPCGCCKVCKKGPNEQCGGPWFIYGNCGRGLFCNRDESDFNSDGVCLFRRRRGRWYVSFRHAD